jgi:hypothetical protein
MQSTCNQRLFGITFGRWRVRARRLLPGLTALISFSLVHAQTMKAPDIIKDPTLYVVPYAHLDTQWRWEMPHRCPSMALPDENSVYADAVFPPHAPSSKDAITGPITSATTFKSSDIHLPSDWDLATLPNKSFVS